MSIRGYLGVTDRKMPAPDTSFAVMGLVLAVLLVPMYLFTSTIFTLMIPLALGIASGMYLISQRYQYEGLAIEQIRISARTGHVLRMTTLVGIAAMVFLATLTGGRTVPFYGVATLTFVLVFVRILFLRRPAIRPGILLAEMLGFAIVLRAAALLTTPGFIGIDVWVHIPNYAASIQEAGQLQAIADTKYFGSPLYHLLVVVAAEAFNSTLRTGLYASLGLVMPLSILLMYYTTKRFLPVRWALFAAATFAIADWVVQWSLHIIPTSMGLVFFLGVFYGTATIFAMDRSQSMYTVVLLFGVATVLTHQISTFILLVFLGVGTLVQLFVRTLDREYSFATVAAGRTKVNFFAILAVIAPLTIIDWSISPSRGTSFLSGMLEDAVTRLQSPELFGSKASQAVDLSPIQTDLVSVPVYVEVIFALGLTVLLFLSLAGAFALLQPDRLHFLSLIWILTTGVMLFVGLGMPLLGLTFLIPTRWLAFAFVPMILLTAHGLQHFETSLAPRQFAILLVVFIALFTGPMLIDHKASIEDPVFDDAQFTPAYSESELEAAETISTLHPAETRIYADRPYFLLLRDWQLLRGDVLRLTADGAVSDDHVVYRTALSEGGPMVAYRSSEYRVQLSPETVCRSAGNVVYSNGDVRYCRTPS
jgi:hypothetical protein